MKLTVDLVETVIELAFESFKPLAELSAEKKDEIRKSARGANGWAASRGEKGLPGGLL